MTLELRGTIKSNKSTDRKHVTGLPLFVSFAWSYGKGHSVASLLLVEGFPARG